MHQYVVVDFLWYRKKEDGASVTASGYDVIDEWGRPIPDPVRWPSSTGGNGFKPIADQVHSMGLKFGIHVMRGISTQAVLENTPIFGILVMTHSPRIFTHYQSDSGAKVKISFFYSTSESNMESKRYSPRKPALLLDAAMLHEC